VLWAAYPAVVKFYMFAGYSCYYKKGVGRGNSLGVHSFDGNETQLSSPAPTHTLRKAQVSTQDNMKVGTEGVGLHKCWWECCVDVFA